MVARINTVAFQGIDVLDIDCQVQMATGQPVFAVVGLPDKAVGESRERVRAALHALGLGLPPKRIVVKLAPADVAKEGSHFDLAIALGLLTVMGVMPEEEIARFCALGELALDGAILPVAGVLPAAINASAHGRGLICPQACGAEAAWAGDIEVVAAPTLLALINHFKGSQVLCRPQPRVEQVRGRRSRPAGHQWAGNREARPWRLPPPAGTTSCSSACPAPASRCWPCACRGCCRRLTTPRRSRSR